MELLFALVIGGLFAAGLYMLLRRSMVRLIIGLVLVAHAATLLVFVTGRLVRGGVPVIPEGRALPEPPFPDPLTQALILTAIVINFGLLAFTLVLFQRTYQEVGTDDLDQMRATDRE